MGRKSPRYSAGASGFISHMSMWDAPPHKKKSTVDRAGLRRVSGVCAAETERPNGRPKHAAVDAVRKARRLKVEPNRAWDRWLDMAGVRGDARVRTGAKSDGWAIRLLTPCNLSWSRLQTGMSEGNPRMWVLHGNSTSSDVEAGKGGFSESLFARSLCSRASGRISRLW